MLGMRLTARLMVEVEPGCRRRRDGAAAGQHHPASFAAARIRSIITCCGPVSRGSRVAWLAPQRPKHDGHRCLATAAGASAQRCRHRQLPARPAGALFTVQWRAGRWRRPRCACRRRRRPLPARCSFLLGPVSHATPQPRHADCAQEKRWTLSQVVVFDVDHFNAPCLIKSATATAVALLLWHVFHLRAR